jgi:hypothetical protein
MNFDANGLIVTTAGDGGDTLAEESRYWFLYWFNFVFMSKYDISLKLSQRKTPQEVMTLLETSPGIYVRNPLTYNTPNTTSRDQLMPVIFYCAAYKDYARLGRLFKAVFKRAFFAQNDSLNGAWKLPDQMITCLGYFIRSGGYYTAILYPLLYIFDTLDLLGTLLYLIFPFSFPVNSTLSDPTTWITIRSNTQVDDNNTDVGMLHAMAFKPTLISILNRLIWGQFRPRNAGNALGYSNNCLAAMAYYHSPANQGNIEVTELYTAPLLKYLKRLI